MQDIATGTPQKDFRELRCSHSGAEWLQAALYDCLCYPCIGTGCIHPLRPALRRQALESGNRESNDSGYVGFDASRERKEYHGMTFFSDTISPACDASYPGKSDMTPCQAPLLSRSRNFTIAGSCSVSFKQAR